MVLMSGSDNSETTKLRSADPTPANRERRERVSVQLALNHSRPTPTTPLNRKQRESERPRLGNRKMLSMHLTHTTPDNRERRERVSAVMPGKSAHALRPTSTPSGNDTCFFTKQRLHTTQTTDSKYEQPA